MMKQLAKLGLTTLALTIPILAGWTAGAPATGAVEDPSTQKLVRANNLGVALMEQLKFEEAAAEFEKNTRLNSSFAPAWVNLGIAHFYRQDYAAAEKAFRQALKIDPKQVHSHYMLGLIYRNQDQIPQALEAFGRVQQLDPDDPSTNYFLGLLYSREKDYAKAVGYLRKAIQKQPYNASARYNLAIALLRGGSREEGQEQMNEFRKLQGQFGTDTVGLQYLEQGKYSLVIDQLAPYLPKSDGAAPGVQVAFREVSAEAGLTFRHGASAPKDFKVNSAAALQNDIAPYLGSGLSFGDYDGDGLPDLYLANASARGARGALFRNKGDGRFEETTLKAGLTFAGKTMAALWGDIDNDGKLDLYLINCGPNALYRNQGDGTFKDVTTEAGVGDPAWGVAGTFVDYDHDNDLDLFVANLADPARVNAGAAFPDALVGVANRLYQNDGKGVFTEVGEESRLAGGALATTAVMATDFNNSRDIDFYLVNHGAPNQLFSNLRNRTFADVAAAAGAKSTGQAGLGVGDVNHDGLVDFALPGLKASASRLLVNQGNETFKSETFGSALAAAGSLDNAQFLDYDNDGDLDLLLAGSALSSGAAAPGRNLILLENRAGVFRDATAAVGLDRFGSVAARGLSVADYDRDGDLDFAVSVAGASPLLFRNDGGNKNNWIQVQLSGVNSNHAGIGAKVEILAGSDWQKAEVYGGNGFLSQSPTLVHFGLGQRKGVDVVRLLWPGGVLQSEIDKAANQRITIQELDRKGTSCPILYVWDGSGYRFATDFLGGSAFGYLLAPGTFNTPDTDETIKLDRRSLALKEGKVALTMNNQLEEVIFFDRLQLLAVDHPADYEVYPDEKLLPGPPYDPFRLISVSAPRAPLSARDEAGRDLLPQLLEIDRVYADGFRNLPYKGYAELHELTLDLGPVSADRAILLMHAWIDYADSTSNLAASQAGVKLTPPYLQVQDPQGEWVTVVERMGFPAGLPKTMTVDLSGKFLSASRKVKIVTSMRIYWDQILVESGPAREDFRISRLEADSAELRFKGFPRYYSPDGRQPKVYDYDDARPDAPWKVHVGAYTRFGDVRELLLRRDDQFVVTRSGDEIEALFDVGELPPLPDGWTRDYLVQVVGFGKDMDVNSATPDTVGPLPFHGMPCYPYPDPGAFAADPARAEYLRNWNTRIVEESLPPLP